MDIQEIKRRVDLLKMANNKKYCLVPELAKELKVSKTDLMQFILDNPKLFHTDNRILHKETFYTGGFGDSSAHPVDYAISPDGLEKIKQVGWTFNELSLIQKGGK